MKESRAVETYLGAMGGLPPGDQGGESQSSDSISPVGIYIMSMIAMHMAELSWHGEGIVADVFDIFPKYSAI